jgi:hypothetical protein
MALGPYDSVDGCLAVAQVRFGRLDEMGSLHDAPEQVEAEIDRDAEVVGQEVRHAPQRECVEAVEQDDGGEVEERAPR